MRRSTTARVAALGVLWGGVASTARAEDGDWSLTVTHDPAFAKTETFGGAEKLGGALSIYFGSTYAPSGAIREDGLRLRLTTSYGWYSYDGVTRVDGRLRANTFHAQTSHSDAMLGYQAKLGPATVKAFVGAAFDGHGTDLVDPGYALAGKAIGVKGAVETWLDLGEIGFASLDASWTAAHDIYSSRLRLGYRLLPALSLGPEAGLYGNAISHGGRGGGFVRYEWATGEVSASGGAAGDRNGEPGSYATVNVLLRY